MITSVKGKKAGLLPIFCAMVYDSFLILGCIFGLAFIAILMNGGNAIEPKTLGAILLRIAMFALWAFFYAFFISRQGQTLGMRAWRLVLVNHNLRPPHFLHALWRWAVAVGFLGVPLVLSFEFFAEIWRKAPILALLWFLPIGIAYFWRYIDPKSRSLIDILSRSQLWRVEKNPYPKTLKEKSC